MSSEHHSSHSRRRSTVYDLAALRLKPDGTRRKLRRRQTIRDAQGNWISKDAAGPSKIKKQLYELPNEMQQEVEGEAFDFSTCGIEDISDEKALKPYRYKRRRNAQNESGTVKLGSRALKRRRFAEDYSYLDDAKASLSAEYPSTELLKIIHRFSSRYYSERGLLLNASQRYRREKKERKLKSTSGELKRSQSLPSVGSSSDEHSDSESKVKKRRRGEHIKDMYQSFDGSALLALGMFVQFQVSEMTKKVAGMGLHTTTREESPSTMYTTEEKDDASVAPCLAAE